MRIVITGANRGIGLELARQYVARGEVVEATVRDPARATELQALASESPGRLRLHACDVRDEQSVRAFARGLAAGGVDLLINNAGVKGAMESLEGQDLKDVMNTFDANTLGPIRVTRALLPRLREGPTKKLAHISSNLGSITDNTTGGLYGYRMSKVALNMANRSMAVDLREEGMVCLVLSPGWVKTDMGGQSAPTRVEESCAGMIRVIDAASISDTGRFLDFNGVECAW